MNGDNIVIGTTNRGESKTALVGKYVGVGNSAGLEVDVDRGDAITGVTQNGHDTGAVVGINNTNNGYYSVRADGVLGIAYTGGAGVHGISASKWGCLGESWGSVGVYGQSNGYVGVLGASSSPGNSGVLGYAPNSGVQGISFEKFGVGVEGWGAAAGLYGDSALSSGVRGLSTRGNGVYGTCTSVDDNGDPISTGVGVRGDSDGGIGIYGSGGSLAGQFEGPVVVRGDFTVVSGAKSAAVRHPDGSHRLLYAVESPESWFEDFGTAKLRKGGVEVELDNDFVKLVAGGSDYHVFLTPRGDSLGLYVSRQKRGSFEVTEQQNGKSNIAFNYRVVAKRKDIKGARFQKVAIPKRLPGDIGPVRKRPGTPALIKQMRRPKRGGRK